jgi:hypothetical protein
MITRSLSEGGFGRNFLTFPSSSICLSCLNGSSSTGISNGRANSSDSKHIDPIGHIDSSLSFPDRSQQTRPEGQLLGLACPDDGQKLGDGHLMHPDAPRDD